VSVAVCVLQCVCCAVRCSVCVEVGAPCCVDTMGGSVCRGW